MYKKLLKIKKGYEKTQIILFKKKLEYITTNFFKIKIKNNLEKSI